MNRRMLQAALVSGAFGVVAVAGFAVAQPASPQQTLAEQEARADQDPGLEVEGLVTPDPGGADVVVEDTAVAAPEADASASPAGGDDTNSVDEGVDAPEDTDSVERASDDADDADDDEGDDDGSDEDDSLDSDDS